MSYGRMAEFIEIISTENTKDADGFSIETETVLASVRASKEAKNASWKWEKILNNAAFAGGYGGVPFL